MRPWRLGGGTLDRHVSWDSQGVDGDEDLAPRVLAMAVSAKTAGDARGLLRRRRQTGGCFGLALLDTFLKFK